MNTVPLDAAKIRSEIVGSTNMHNDAGIGQGTIDEPTLAELERIVGTLPPECLHDPECCDVVGDPELLTELEQFANTLPGVTASKTGLHEFSAETVATEVVAICGATTAIAGALAAYFRAKKRTLRVKHKGKEYEFTGYTEREIARMLKLFARVILKRK